jgi:hypothetical protein
MGRILILGGYGTFGGRLVRLLADEPRLTLIVAGRSPARAQEFCATLAAAATLLPARFDRDGDVTAQMRALAPDLVIDASGPFQAYGDDPYRVVRAALALGIGYLDLADGSDFVAGIAQFDAEARARGIFALAGVSSFPVLTAAAARTLARGMRRVDAISGGIAPSPYADVGINVIRAIASYAGKPVKLVRDGRAAVGYGLIDCRRFTIAPPGRLPLRSLRFSLVDVPDLRLLPRLWPSLREVFMGAGPVPAFLHRALGMLAWLVRLKLLPSLLPLAPPIYWAAHALSFGEHRGGMFVALEGEGPDGGRIARSCHLLAEGDDGPLIPSMAAAALVRRWLAGAPPRPGARASLDDLELADYEPLFAPRQIVTGWRETPPPDAPLYRRILGEAFEHMPVPLRVLHDLRGEFVAEGRATVTRGKSVPARLIAWVMGFPRAGEDVPVAVAFRAEAGREYWRRTFAGRSFGSVQEAGRGAFEHLLCERFGPLNAGMAPVLDGERLRLVMRRWSLFGVPLPLALGPRGEAYEFAQDGRFHFSVEIALPLIGLIVAYRGWLVPRAAEAARA